MWHRSVGPMSVLLVLWLAAPAAADEPQFQLWGNVTLNWIKSRELTLGVDVEPKVLVVKPPTSPDWVTLDVTPSIEYTKGNWADVLAELLVARTKQTDNLNSTEITPRVGFRFHILSNIANDLLKEKRPRRRLVVRDLLRFEWRNLYYSGDKPKSSSFRLRNRSEVLYPLNRPRVTDDGAYAVTTDVEWFWTTQDLEERFAGKQRVRAGISYRHNYAWRFEGLYILDRARHTATDGFTRADSAVDVRVRRVW